MTYLTIIAAAMIAMTAAARADTRIVMEEIMVPSSDPGIEIYVRNKRPADMTSVPARAHPAYVHGATYPAHRPAFDLQLDGMSWMDYIAQRGYDVYLLDVRGYGRSTRPKEMAEKRGSNRPIVRGETAVKDIGAVVDFILKRRNIAAAQPARLVVGHHADGDLHDAERRPRSSGWCCTRRSGSAPRHRWCRPARDRRRPIAWCARDQALGRWLTGVPEDKKAELIPAGWFDKWADATWATDPEGAKMNPPVLRAPNGVVQDGLEFFGQRRQGLLRSGQDHGADAADRRRVGPRHAALHGQALFPLLVNAPGKRLVQLAEGTHTIIMEKNRAEAVRGGAGLPRRAGQGVLTRLTP